MSLNEFSGSSRTNAFERMSGRVVSTLDRTLGGVRRLHAALNPWGMASIVGGFALACFGAVFAARQGVSPALALMAAYCVVTTCIASTVLLAMLSQRAPKLAERPVELRTNLRAWKLVNELRVSDACRLWCDIEPGSPYSQEAIAWATAMLDAIKRGDLPILPRSTGSQELDERERTNPSWRTRVSREALRSWADAHGHCPAFLHG